MPDAEEFCGIAPEAPNILLTASKLLSGRPSSSKSPTRIFPGQIDEDDVRVLRRPVEENLPAVRRHVKALDGIARLQVGELAALPGIEINYIEVLAEIIAEQRDNLSAARQKAVTITSSQYPQLGQGVWLLLGRRRFHGVSCARRLTRQQVINERKSARERLARRLKGFF